MNLADIADEWIGQPVYVIFRDANGQPVRHITLRWLEGVNDEGVWLDKGHYAEPAKRFIRTGKREFHPWTSLWHVHFDPLIAELYNPPEGP